MSLLFNMLSRLVITFLPRSKRLLISWLQSPSAVILEPRKIKSATVSPSICHEVMGPDAMILVFWILSFKPAFSLSSFTFIKRLQSCSKKKKKRRKNAGQFFPFYSRCFTLLLLCSWFLGLLLPLEHVKFITTHCYFTECNVWNWPVLPWFVREA